MNAQIIRDECAHRDCAITEITFTYDGLWADPNMPGSVQSLFTLKEQQQKSTWKLHRFSNFQLNPSPVVIAKTVVQLDHSISDGQKWFIRLNAHTHKNSLWS